MDSKSQLGQAIGSGGGVLRDAIISSRSTPEDFKKSTADSIVSSLAGVSIHVQKSARKPSIHAGLRADSL